MDLTLSTTQSLMPLPPALGDFDYAAFLDEDIDYMAEDNGYSNSGLSDSSTQKKSPAEDASGGILVGKKGGNQQGRQRLERRGHTKSRRGCFNCKRRRIKCQENHPACGHCVKTGLKCEYPSLPQITHQPHHQIPLFSLQDMRFFQHFLMQCYPHQPIGNENIWTHEVPCLSQTHEYLMHAILGMAACDLGKDDPTLLACAMAHRIKAIKAIKKALGEMPKSNSTYEEANALVATCFALTFQSVSFEDGMAEFMTFIRGILIVGMQMWMKGIKPMFANMMGNDAQNMLEPHMATLPLIPKEWADGAVTAIESLRGLCRDEVEIEYYDLILDMAQHLHVSSWEAYKMLSKHYGWWMMLPHDKFQKIIDPTNQVMILLAAHWIALKQIMAFITESEHRLRQKYPQSDGGGMDQGMGRWLRHLNSQVDDEHLIYNHWPMWVLAQLDQDLGFFGKTL